MSAAGDIPNVNRSQLRKRMRGRLPPSLSNKDVDEAIALVFEKIGDALAQGHRVELRGFGSFSLRVRHPRTARNPRTGAAVAVGVRRVAYFKPGRSMRDRLLGAEAEQARRPVL